MTKIIKVLPVDLGKKQAMALNLATNRHYYNNYYSSLGHIKGSFLGSGQNNYGYINFIDYNNNCFWNNDKLKYAMHVLSPQEQEALSVLVLRNASVAIVEMDEKIGYNLSTIFLYKDGNIIKRINGITTLHFINTISRLTFHNEASQNFSGYGELM